MAFIRKKRVSENALVETLNVSLVCKSAFQLTEGRASHKILVLPFTYMHYIYLKLLINLGQLPGFKWCICPQPN